MSKKLKLKGKAKVQELDQDGNVVSEEEKENVITDDGAGVIAQLIGAKTVDDFEYMAIGSGTSAEGASDSSLGSEQDRSDSITSSVNGKEVEWVYTFLAGAGKSAITELGMFNDPSDESGTMMNRLTFAAKDNENNDLRITYTLTVS